MRASILSRRNYVGILHFRRTVALFFAFAISLSLLALAQAAKILAKQAPPSMGMDFKEHSKHSTLCFTFSVFSIISGNLLLK